MKSRAAVIGIVLLCSVNFVRAGDKDRGGAITPLQQVFLIQQLHPHIKQIGILCDLSQHPKLAQRLARIGAQIGVRIIIRDTKDLRNVSKNFKYLAEVERVDAVWIFPDAVLDHPSARKYLIKEAVMDKILLIAPDREMVRKGATFFAEKQGGQVMIFVNSKALELLGLKISEELSSTAQVVSN